MTIQPNAETLSKIIAGLANFQTETDNMTFIQLIILLEIGKFPQGAPYDDIVKALNTPRSGVASTVKKYDKFVSRVMRLDRSVAFKLTPLGNELIGRFSHMLSD
ncbi:MAG: hypothetical protein HRU29_05745 [Rhizobiales bacterium]|nr:hypothetical protein [Hyphomicrobiales bacterium]NRB13887.1 hypothetical protein [Hyphomicrobiales bacterium]